MKLLLTRPNGQNQPMMDALDKLHIPYIVMPLITIKSVYCESFDSQLSSLNTDMVIFVSVNAVICADKSLRAAGSKSWPQNIQYFAVGNATWQACNLLGIKALKAPEDNQQSEGLLSLNALKQVSGKCITIIRGNGGRDLMGSSLDALGAKVSYLEVYQRACPKLDGAKVINDWRDQGVDTIMLTSKAALVNLITLIPKTRLGQQLFSWLQACHIIVPSERTKQQAIELGFYHVTNAQGASVQSMLSKLINC